MTQSASWMERSASSITSLLEPRTTMLTVFPGLAQPVICNQTDARPINTQDMVMSTRYEFGLCHRVRVKTSSINGKLISERDSSIRIS